MTCDVDIDGHIDLTWHFGNKALLTQKYSQIKPD